MAARRLARGSVAAQAMQQPTAMTDTKANSMMGPAKRDRESLLLGFLSLLLCVLAWHLPAQRGAGCGV
jgi:hypothetical protein